MSAMVIFFAFDSDDLSFDNSFSAAVKKLLDPS